MIRKNLQRIFKKISYLFFFQIYGKIEKTIDVNSDSRIKVKSTEIGKSAKYKIYKINNARLYTDRIHDTAALLDNKIIEGASFQLRGNKNEEAIHNIVFKKGTPRKLRKIKGTVLSLLTGGGGNSNYWHWLYDVLPRLRLCEEIKKLKDVDYFLFPSLEKKFQVETLKILNIEEKKLLPSKKFRHILASELIVTDHPYNLTNNFHNDSQNIPIWIIKWLREQFLKNLNKLKTNYPKKIYLERGDSKLIKAQERSMINEDEVKKFLINKNFAFVKLNELPFAEQINHFYNANYVIGLHGAGFANLSFCRERTKVIEFRTETTGSVIENLAKKNNLEFDSIICAAKAPEYAKQSGHIKIPLDLLEQKMSEI